MEMKLFQYRDKKATKKKKKNPNMRDGVLAVVVLLMTVPIWLRVVELKNI